MAFHAFRIYQLKDITNTDYAFRDFDCAKEHGFSLDDYEKRFTGTIEFDGTLPQFLEEIFIIFNDYDEFKKQEFAEKFTGHSLSVSDLVKVEGRYYYVDDIGFKEVDFI